MNRRRYSFVPPPCHIPLPPSGIENLLRARSNLRRRRRDLIHSVQVLVKNLVHGEHVHPVLLKNCAHRIVTSNLPLVGRVLQVSLFNIFPDLLDGLWARELRLVKEGGECRRERHWFLGVVSIGVEVICQLHEENDKM